LALALTALCAACTTTTQVAQVPHKPLPDPATLMPALENRIYELVDAERHKLDPKAKELSLDSELVGIAREKSTDMAEHNYIAHTAPNGQTAAGIVMDKDAAFQGLLGENLAEEHYLKAYGVDVDEMAHRFVDAWLASKSHRDNLALPVYDRTGVGAAVNGDTVYVTELFASDLGLPPPRPPNDSGTAAKQAGSPAPQGE
jgi:uncharacterized protein YkwD